MDKTVKKPHTTRWLIAHLKAALAYQDGEDKIVDEAIILIIEKFRILEAERDHWWQLVERAKLLLPGWPPEEAK